MTYSNWSARLGPVFWGLNSVSSGTPSSLSVVAITRRNFSPATTRSLWRESVVKSQSACSRKPSVSTNEYGHHMYAGLCARTNKTIFLCSQIMCRPYKKSNKTISQTEVPYVYTYRALAPKSQVQHKWVSTCISAWFCAHPNNTIFLCRQILWRPSTKSPSR